MYKDEIFAMNIMDTLVVLSFLGTTLKIQKTICYFTGCIILMNVDVTQSVMFVDYIFDFSPPITNILLKIHKNIV